MSFSGDLGGIGLADVFQNVSANRADGTLCVKWRRTERYVRFEAGGVTGFSLGVGRGLPMTDHLRSRGFIDPAELDRVLAKGKRSRKPVTRLCVEAGALDDETVRSAMTECVEEGLYELLALREAEYRYDEGAAPARVFDAEQARVGLRLEVGPILMEAARRCDEYERIQKVVASDEDVFVLLEGWEDRVPDDLAAAVAEAMDGRVSVNGIVTAVGRSPFHVKKAIFELVQAGVSRPGMPEELAEAADEELAAGAVDDALRLMARALELARSDVELRVRYAALLEQTGRTSDAAVEHARLGHDAERSGDFEAAREAYDRAVELSSEDLALHERRVALLEQCASDDDLAAAVLAVVERHAEMGLADRSKTMLAEIVERRGLQDREDLVRALARVEASLGKWDEAARLFRRLGERVVRTDEERGLALLRAALEQSPADAGLRNLVEEIESGRARRRRIVRRRVWAAASAISVAVSLGFAGVSELIASRRAAFALSSGLGELTGGEGVVALERLTQVSTDYGWTWTGRSARIWIERLTDLQLGAVRELVAAARYGEAEEICTSLEERIGRADLRATCTALRERIARERSAFDVLERVERRQERPTLGDLEELEALGVPAHFAFLLARLPEVQDHQVRAALLRAIARVDDPRAYPAVVRVLMKAVDPATQEAAREVLRRASRHRAAGRESEWAEVYDELETALRDPSRATTARDALDLLRGA